MPDSSSLQREVEAETTRLFPGAVRRVEWLRYGDSPLTAVAGSLPGPATRSRHSSTSMARP